MDDLLGSALQGNISKPSSRRRRTSNQRSSPQTLQSGTSYRSQHDNGVSKQKPSSSPTLNGRRKSIGRRKCCFCSDAPAAIIIENSLTAPKAYCMLHYYTTSACRVPLEKVQKVESNDNEKNPKDNNIMNGIDSPPSSEFYNQLPYVQELFSEAFTELQKEISTESARSFQAMMKRDNDPLSILIDAPRSNKKKLKNNKTYVNKHDSEYRDGGGFIRQSQAKEQQLIKEQSRRIEAAARESAKLIEDNDNIYRRRKTRAKSSWNLILEKKIPNDDTGFDLQNQVTCEMTCSCGSTSVESTGNITSCNGNVSKADIWGVKRENDVIIRYHCSGCGKQWNEEE
mmetsp:Transcript_13765/g.15473  ORF Transcript_13765/g.15473 Transcript_13765/m.15473 type:complete len:341 (+) Transcript_13765:3-1025(+)